MFDWDLINVYGELVIRLGDDCEVEMCAKSREEDANPKSLVTMFSDDEPLCKEFGY